MFEISYAFRKGGPQYKCEYPSSTNRQHNMFKIKGKCDQGKSTTMQIIALGLFGLSSNDIDKRFKDKMARLLSKDTEEFNFRFKITGRSADNEPIVLESRLESKEHEPTLYVNGEKKGPDYVRDHFKILFDVPDDPMVKLKGTLDSVEDHLNRYESLVKRYQETLMTKIREIDDFLGKEKRKDELGEEIKNKNDELKNLENLFEAMKSKFEESKRAYIVNLYETTSEQVERYKDQKAKLKEQKENLAKTGAGPRPSAYLSLLKSFFDCVQGLRQALSDSKNLTQMIQKKEGELVNGIAEDVGRIVTPDNNLGRRMREWGEFFGKVLTELESQPLYRQETKEEKQISLIEDLIVILLKHIEANPQVPGTKDLNVNQFISELESSKRVLSSKISQKIKLTASVSECEGIIRNLKKVALALQQVPETKGNEDEEYSQVSEALKAVDQEIRDRKEILGELEPYYKRLAEAEKNKVRSSDIPNRHEYERMKKDVDDLSQRISNTKIEIGAKKEALREKEFTTKPPAKMNREELVRKHNLVTILLRKMQKWTRYIQEIDTQAMTPKHEADPESMPFYMALADYFASILKVVHFEHKEWKARRVDFVNQCYVVEDRLQPIGFHDVGTGHTALNSLLARMRQDYGKGRKKIVLFDDVGFIDKELMEDLLSEIKEQVRSGKVLLALLSQVDNSLEKVEFEPVPISG